MNQITLPPKLEIIPASAPFSEASVLAERLLCRHAVAGRLAAPLSAEQGAASCWRRKVTAMTAKRRGTTRPWRSPIG